MLSNFTPPLSEKLLIQSDYGLTLVNSLRPELDEKNVNLPNSRQCVGTNRLWGGNLGAAAFIDLKKTKKVEKIDLIDIAILSRSFLVIDDYIKDEYISRESLNYSNEWLCNIANRLNEIYNRIGEDFGTHLFLVHKADQIHKNRIWTKNFVNSYHSSIGKCLIFFMPYRLKSIAANLFNYSERMIFLETFFFCCQILDDFYDVEEDIKKKTNHNIFLENVPTKYWEIINKSKQKLLSSVLLLIKKNLDSLIQTKAAEGNEILDYYLRAGNWWVNKKLLLTHGSCLKQITEQSFETFIFDESIVLELMKISDETLVNYSLEEIRPEIFQTAFMGKRHIYEV